MGLTLITPPDAEPITLAEAKAHCRVDGDSEDALLTTLIRAARLQAERETGRAIPAQTWKQTFDCFPDWYFRLSKPPLISVTSIVYTDTAGDSQTVSSSDYRVSVANEPGLIEPSYDAGYWPTAQDITDAVAVTFKAGWASTSIAATTASGSQTVTPGSVAGILAGSVLTIGNGTEQEQVAVASVTSTTFTATFARAHAAACKVSAVPDDIQAAIKLLVGHLYTNREEVSEAVLSETPMAAKYLLQGNWTGVYL